MSQSINYQKFFESFNDLNVLIIGDVMVDSYLWGDVDRISPEAPVPIVSVNKRENRLGGAANVALNVKALGANPILCSIVGLDVKGQEFLDLLKKRKMDSCGIVQSEERITTTKFRVIGNNVQMLRVDEEIDGFLSAKENEKMHHRFNDILEKFNIDVIIFQDYDKGVITSEFISYVVNKANELNIPISVDPKRRNFLDFKNVTLFKPNIKELKEGLNIDFNAKDHNELKAAVKKLRAELNAQHVLVTLSEDGVFIDYKTDGERNKKIIPSHVRSISDVSGAGDTVISVASLCLALNIEHSKMAAISNLAGGLVCEEVGVVPIDKTKLLSEVQKLKFD